MTIICTPTGRVRSGVCPTLEYEASALLADSLKGVTSHSEKSDILTTWKERDRLEREVLSSSGTVDPAVRKGLYVREMNPVSTHLNSRDGYFPATRCTEDVVASYEGYEGLLNVI